ncbi:ThiF family adenylyltransferase [Mitsuaria sp. TWR114]|uniref:HesA/MoeB/ThiF family protein n=1 Tax=Mitsuaria sp. TWR114 TaxID=2601731 RepID=UPI00164C3E56|nr:ThiF family adenylyltransferase [Mitsuaria sp. TWR114]
MRYVLKMRGVHHRRQAALLRAAMPRESVCFLLCRRVGVEDDVIYLVDDIVPVEPTDYIEQAEDIASVSPAAMSSVAKRARADGRVIVMAHLHPMTDRDVHFSHADHVGNARSFAFFHRQAPQPEHVALVWNSAIDECQGLVYGRDRATAVALDSVVVVDEDRWVEHVHHGASVDRRFDRQALLLGPEGQHAIARAAFTIVGLGGTGSLASLALIHHGARDMTLVDDDLVDLTNLPRIPASCPKDAGVRNKAELARDYAIAHAPEATVRAITLNVEDPEVLRALVRSAVVIVCTDNTTSRAFLNQICQQYLIPLLDIGVQFVVDANGAVVNEIGRVNLCRPGAPCLWCSGHINAERLAAEAKPRAERDRAGSYLRGFDLPEPSMLAFNMEIVGRAMQVLVGYITGLFSQPPTTFEQRSFLRPKGGMMSRMVAKVNQPGCLFCASVGKAEDVPPIIRHRAM